MASQAKRAFPQYNCAEFFAEPSSAGQPLIFNFTAEKEYAKIESIDLLRHVHEKSSNLIMYQTTALLALESLAHNGTFSCCCSYLARETLEASLAEYNTLNAVMDLVLFDEVRLIRAC